MQGIYLMQMHKGRDTCIQDLKVILEGGLGAGRDAWQSVSNARARDTCIHGYWREGQPCIMHKWLLIIILYIPWGWGGGRKVSGIFSSDDLCKHAHHHSGVTKQIAGKIRSDYVM